MSKNIDSFSVFLETVDPGVQARTNGTRFHAAPVVSPNARAVLTRLDDVGGSAPAKALQDDLQLGALEFRQILDELFDCHLVTADGEVLRRTSDS